YPPLPARPPFPRERGEKKRSVVIGGDLCPTPRWQPRCPAGQAPPPRRPPSFTTRGLLLYPPLPGARGGGPGGGGRGVRGLAQDHQGHPAVLGAALTGLVVGDRLGGAIGDDVDAMEGELVLFVEVLAHRLGPRQAELLVVVVPAHVVGVPLDLDV